MGTAPEKRARAESIIETIGAACQAGGLRAEEQHMHQMAERLDVPRALVFLAVDQLDVDDIDALVAWWPRKDGV